MDASVDVIISNCVINLAADKQIALRERPACCVEAADSPSPMSSPIPTWTTATRREAEQWTGCIVGALTDGQSAAPPGAGLVDIEIAETHRVHPHVASAIIRARKP